MAKLTISDLVESKELDSKAMSTVRGGFQTNVVEGGFQDTPQAVVGGHGPIQAINNPINFNVFDLDNDYYVEQNPELFNLLAGDDLDVHSL